LQTYPPAWLRTLARAGEECAIGCRDASDALRVGMYPPAHDTEVMVRYSPLKVFLVLLIGAAVLTACRPEGSIDVADSRDGTVHVAGWARDPDTTDPIQVHVYVDGQLVAVGDAAGSRPDVQASKAGGDKPAGPNHGFDIDVPVPPGARQVCVYGIDRVGGDDNGLIGCRPLNRCVVALHGLGGNGAPSVRGLDGITYVYPAGNDAAGWGRRWLYDDEGAYAAARDVVRRAIDDNGCGQVVVDGFSNGGGFAGKLLCRGETFDGRVVGFVLDDPVTDRSGDGGCVRAPGVAAAMYWTGGLDFAPAGTDCASRGWTCDGASLVGRDEYAARLGVAVQPSIHGTHQPYIWPPEIAAWL
jgi:hypothetical protein